MPKFEKEQQIILDAESQNQLVSAGAGSGKTTVMIEKIGNLILDNKVDIDNLLVVTFTVLASQEMKDRLVKKMTAQLETANNPDEILNKIEKIKTASIDTIDGFASKTIKKYFYELNISPNIEIVSDASKDYYLTKAMKKTIDELSKNADDANLLLDCLGGNKRNFEPVEKQILEIYKNIINIGDYEKFLLDAENEYENPIKSELVVNEKVIDIVSKVKRSIIENSNCFEKEVKDKVMGFYSRLDEFNINLSLISNLQKLKAIETIKFSKKEKDNNAGLDTIENCAKEFFKLKDDFEKDQINEKIYENNLKSRDFLMIFLKYLKIFIKNYAEVKKNNNVIDFNDLTRLMLKLLQSDRIKKELNDKYKYIFIDEYQDVSPLQDELLSKVVGPDSKVFMVGDVKQSIYGFRGASPEWFLKKYYDYKSNAVSGEAFDMNINFRSSPMILQFINDVFSKLMTKGSADIDYKNDCIIDPKRDDIVEQKVSVMLVKDKGDESEAVSGIYSVKEDCGEEEIDTDTKEAYLVAKQISNLIGKEFYDANIKEKRVMKYSDIAILMRSDKSDLANTLISVLNAHNIPVNSTSSLNISESECIKLIMSILKCVSNMGDDVDYYASFMALTNLSVDDIASLRDTKQTFYDDLINAKDNELVVSGFEKLELIKEKSYVLSNSQLIRYILNDLKLKYFILSKPNGEKEFNLVLEFLKKLSPVEDELNLAEFIEVVESNANKSGDFETNDRPDSVTLESIHKSKGLEYPVVFLFGASKNFRYIIDTDVINFDADLGIGVDCFDNANRKKTYSLTKYAIRLKNKQKGYKEELRLLYVALTRAKNKLFITGNYSKNFFAKIEEKYNNYMNLILNVFLNSLSEGHNEFEHCTIDFFEDAENELRDEAIADVEMIDGYSKYKSKDNLKFSIPLKNTVTGLNGQSVSNKKFLRKDIINTIEQYNNLDENRALVGTHYHSALEKIDYMTAYKQNTNFEDVDYKKIKLAHQKISNLITKEDKLHKEAEFMMYVPYCDLVDSKVKDKVLVQGVVDLIIEHENSIDIVDYKFSTLGISALKEKYAEQLELYKRAVEQAFRLPVEHMYIYSINTGELA